MINKNKGLDINQTESQLSTSIVKYLTSQGFKAGKIKTVGIKGRYDKHLFRGVADILWFKYGKTGWIECKKTTKQSEEQKKFQLLCEDCGINYSVIKSLNELIEKGF